MSRDRLTRLLGGAIGVLLLALALLWLLPGADGVRRYAWTPPPAAAPDYSAVAAAIDRPPVPAVGPDTATLSRPLFQPTRRPPPPPAPPAAKPAEPPPPAPPPAPELLDKTTLQGIMTSRGGVASIVARVDGTPRVIRRGERLGEWELVAIGDREVTFAHGDERRSLRLEYAHIAAKPGAAAPVGGGTSRAAPASRPPAPRAQPAAAPPAVAPPAPAAPAPAPPAAPAAPAANAQPTPPAAADVPPRRSGFGGVQGGRTPSGR